MYSASVRQWFNSSMIQLSPWVTHIWRCGGVLALFMMGKFGLQNGSGQLFKWRFKQTFVLSQIPLLGCLCCSEEVVSAGRLFVFQQKGTCARLPGSLGAGQSCGVCSQPFLPRQPEDTWVLNRALCLLPAVCSQPWWPWHILIFASYHCRKKQVGIYLLLYLTEKDPHIQKLL